MPSVRTAALLAALIVGTPAAAQPPTSRAELFGDGVFSTGDYELPPTFEAGGRRAWFTVSTPTYGRMRWIMETERTATGWSAPRVAPFSGQYDDADPYLSPDGSRLFFLSKRPLAPGQPPRRDLDIWVMAREGAGWGPPRHLGERVNGPGEEHYVTSTRDGRLVIAAVRPDSRNLGDLYEVPFEGGAYGEPRNFGPAVNQPDTHETTPWVSPDGSYVIFASRRADAVGDLDLYVTVRDSAGAWGKPVNLGPNVNSTAVDYCPLVSPDGEWLYFSSTRSVFERRAGERWRAEELRPALRGAGNGLGDTYRIRLKDALAGAGVTVR